MNKVFSIDDIPTSETIAIYSIFNKRTKRYYIGSTINLPARLRCHSRAIRIHGGINEKMRDDIRSSKDIEDFVFMIMQTFEDNTITLKELRRHEAEYIALYKASVLGYNSEYHTPYTTALRYGNSRVGENDLLSSSHKQVNRDKLDEIKIRVPKGRKAEIQAHAEARGESINGFITRAIDETIEREGSCKE